MDAVFIVISQSRNAHGAFLEPRILSVCGSEDRAAEDRATALELVSSLPAIRQPYVYIEEHPVKE